MSSRNQRHRLSSRPALREPIQNGGDALERDRASGAPQSPQIARKAIPAAGDDPGRVSRLLGELSAPSGLRVSSRAANQRLCELLGPIQASVWLLAQQMATQARPGCLPTR